MAKATKYQSPASIAFRPEVLRALDEWCIEHNRPRSGTVALLVEQFLVAEGRIRPEQTGHVNIGRGGRPLTLTRQNPAA